MSDYHQREQERRERNAAKAEERRQRTARAARTGAAAPQVGTSYHERMHAIGLRSGVADAHRLAALAVLDGVTPAELEAQLAGTSSTGASTSRGTSATASKRADSTWLTEHDRAQRRSWDNPRGD